MTAATTDALSTEKPSYRRLPGRGRRTTGCVSVGATISTIWLANDHLLLRESAYGLSETYKRFYFRDIQAFVVRRTSRWIAWICTWTILSLLFFFCWGTADWRGWGWPFWSAFCFFLTMIQLARGPSCVTYLITAVQRELLASMNTVRKARRGLKTLVPLIEEKQGTFDAAALAQAGPQPMQRPSSLAPVRSPAGLSGETVSAAPSGLHLLLFATTFVGGCIALWETFKSSPVGLIVSAVLLAVIIILAIVTLAMQSRRRVNKTVAVLTWSITIGYIVAWIVIYTVYTSLYSFQQAAKHARERKPPDISFELTPANLRQMPGFDYVLLVYGACSVALGGGGIGALFFGRPRVKQPPPLPGPPGPETAV